MGYLPPEKGTAEKDSHTNLHSVMRSRENLRQYIRSCENQIALIDEWFIGSSFDMFTITGVSNDKEGHPEKFSVGGLGGNLPLTNRLAQDCAFLMKSAFEEYIVELKSELSMLDSLQIPISSTT